MTPENFYPISEPSIANILSRHKIEVSRWINCVQIAQIVSFNKLTNTASVQIVGKREFVDGEILDYPLLTDCPVFILQGGGSWLEMPIAKDDHCIVLFNDRDIDNWYSSSLTFNPTPNTLRAHSLSDGLVLVGINPLMDALLLSGSGVELHGGPNAVKVSSTKAVDVLSTGDAASLKGTAVNVEATGGAVGVKGSSGVTVEATSGAMAMEAKAGAASFKGIGATVDAAGGVLTLKNAAGNLKAILDDLLTQLQGLKTIDVAQIDTIDPAFGIAMAGIKSRIDTLLG